MEYTHNNFAKFPVGSWAFSREHRDPVRILEWQTVWNHTTYLVWRPAGEQVVWVTADSLFPLEQREQSEQGLDGLIYRVAAARVAEALADDVLLAPLEASVIPLPHHRAKYDLRVSCSLER
ncbi:MAG: hypothetical protein R6U98_02245 [Pirellulaceae bacterium]